MNYGLVDKNIAQEVAIALLEAGAVRLNKEDPFTWASGWKSPIYCDNRITLSYPKTRARICDLLCEVIMQAYPQSDAVSGVATAGIPQGALVANKLQLPLSYIRSKPKGHGMENLIEGRIEAGQKIAVVEDLISTGGSSLKAIDAIRKANADVTVLLSIFNYGFDVAEKNAAEKGVNVVYLSDYESLLPEAVKLGKIKEEDIESLQNWRKNPGDWK